MADKKISQLSAASTPLAGTEVLPIVQSSATVKVATNDLTVRNVRANATTGILQVTGPAAASTRVMTVPDANFTAARTDAGQTFTGVQVFTSPKVITSIDDTNGNELIKVTATASAVNELTVANAAANNPPTVAATGDDTNIDITISPKGSGSVNLSKVNIDGGSIDGTAIGASSVSSGAFSTVTGVTSGNFDQTANFSNSNASYGGGVVGISGNRAGSTLWTFVDGSNTGGAAFSIYGNGNINNTNGVYAAYSDVKLKENIVDATPKLDSIMKLKVRNFNLKSNPELKQIGFIAQEIEQVFPGLVDEAVDRFTKESVKNVKQSVLIPILVKALQELKTEFDAYKASHP